MNRPIRIVILAAALSSATVAYPGVIRVPADQPTIQAGINSASPGDTVLVDTGRYLENVRFRGKNIVLTSRYAESLDPAFILSTIIDGSSPPHADSASTVLIIDGEDSSAVLQGFTITGGSGTDWTDEHGAGVYREGGGILIAASSPTVTHNLIINNNVTLNASVRSTGGGGIRAGDGNPRILGNVIKDNSGRYGAGVVLNYTGVLLTNNIITGNSGGQDYGGGALWMNHNGPSPKLIINNTIVANQTLAVYVWDGSSIIRNCIIMKDSATSAVQIGVRSGGPAVSTSLVQGGWSGTGNISGDPMFSDRGFHLDAGSPCVDAGDTAAVYNDREDPLFPESAIWPSRGSLRNDMGAYGGPGVPPFPFLSQVTSAPPAVAAVPYVSKLERNYPNPFNPTTRISYRLSAGAFVSLKITDLLGREVATLVNAYQQPGEHTAVFHASHLASGVYFCRLVAEPESVAADRHPLRMLLVR